MKQLFLFSLLLLSAIANAQMNLVKNGAFERDLVNWRGEEIAALSPYEKKSGKNSVMINQFTGAEWRALDQIVLIPKLTYAVECSVWIKTDQVENQKEEYKAAAVILEFTNDNDKQISTETIAQVKGTTSWTNYKKAVKIPSGAKKIRIMLALAQTNGTVFFDDVNLKALGEEEYTQVDSQNK
ncbi:carbohydrate binding domain-containing protein [Flavobacterium ginsenosidimutans]|uniref:carbohydrate binding domain-containing protein n=1 Tax=Flavobacterium ginsenosidimutans TaxID=687844 RepID=UPI003D97729C